MTHIFDFKSPASTTKKLAQEAKITLIVDHRVECDLGNIPKVANGPTFFKQIFNMHNKCSSDAQLLAGYVGTQFYHFHVVLSEKCKV